MDPPWLPTLVCAGFGYLAPFLVITPRPAFGISCGDTLDAAPCPIAAIIWSCHLSLAPTSAIPDAVLALQQICHCHVYISLGNFGLPWCFHRTIRHPIVCILLFSTALSTFFFYSKIGIMVKYAKIRRTKNRPAFDQGGQ